MDKAAAIQGKASTRLGVEWVTWITYVARMPTYALSPTVSKSSYPQEPEQPYYRALAHHPELLQQYCLVYNANRRASVEGRAYQELSALVTSVVNQSLYGASLHAQRYQQVTSQQHTIQQVFEQADQAGIDAQEKAVSRFAAKVTVAPQRLVPADIQVLLDAGLSQAEILDVLHSSAMSAWEDRLLLGLGEAKAASV